MQTPELTPYAETIAMFQSGESPDAIVKRMKARGLEQDDIGLLLAAAKARPAGAPLPVAERRDEVGPKRVVDLPAIVLQEPEGERCARCRATVSAADRQPMFQKVYCLDCAALPELAELWAFRQGHWGQRDAWAWAVGAAAVLCALSAVAGFVFFIGSSPMVALLSLGVPLTAAALAGAFFFGWAPARWLATRSAYLMILLAAQGMRALFRGQLPLSVGLPLLLVPIAWAVLAVLLEGSVKNQLFFKLEPTEAELRRALSR